MPYNTTTYVKINAPTSYFGGDIKKKTLNKYFSRNDKRVNKFRRKKKKRSQHNVGIIKASAICFCNPIAHITGNK